MADLCNMTHDEIRKSWLSIKNKVIGTAVFDDIFNEYVNKVNDLDNDIQDKLYELIKSNEKIGTKIVIKNCGYLSGMQLHEMIAACKMLHLHYRINKCDNFIIYMPEYFEWEHTESNPTSNKITITKHKLLQHMRSHKDYVHSRMDSFNTGLGNHRMNNNDRFERFDKKMTERNFWLVAFMLFLVFVTGEISNYKFNKSITDINKNISVLNITSNLLTNKFNTYKTDTDVRTNITTLLFGGALVVIFIITITSHYELISKIKAINNTNQPNNNNNNNSKTRRRNNRKN